MLAVNPEQFACGRVKRHDRTAVAAGGIDHAVDHQRRALQLELRPAAEIIGLEAPGDFQFAEIRRIDLVERPVMRASQIRAIGRPFGVFGALTPRRLRAREIEKAEDVNFNAETRRCGDRRRFLPACPTPRFSPPLRASALKRTSDPIMSIPVVQVARASVSTSAFCRQ